MEKLRIVIGGFIGLLPSGGVTWDYIQYPLGFHLLGHDVYYIEDTMQYSRYQSAGQQWDDPSNSIQYLKETMQRFGLANRWAYRDVATNQCYGLPNEKVKEICNTADIFINVSAATYLRDEYLRIPKRILIDSDPMFTQVQDWEDDHPDRSFSRIQEAYQQYNHLFSFGENIGNHDCRIPTYGFTWMPTRQPICLDYWQPDGKRNNYNSFTTIMNWSTRTKLKYQHEEWGQKDVEFIKFKDIPRKFTKAKFQLIVADSSKRFSKTELKEYGWEIFDPLQKISNTTDYKSFITSSLGEFSVAKETYVKSNSGWFSCRSACYLACGRPVITQDTSWSQYIETGKGLFAFHDMDSAIDALNQVASNPEFHSRQAKIIAEEYFDSNKILKEMLNRM